MRQRFWELGGPTHRNFGMVVDLSLALTKFVFDFRYCAAVQKYGGPNMILVVIWAKIWDIFPRLLKRGHRGPNVCGYFMSAAWGPTVGPTVLGVGGTELSHVWCVDRPIIGHC